MALFAQYAMASAEEALQDAKWMPQSEEDLQATVRGLYASQQEIMLSFIAGCLYWLRYRESGRCLQHGCRIRKGRMSDDQRPASKRDTDIIIGLQKGIATVCTQALDQSGCRSHFNEIRIQGAYDSTPTITDRLN